MGNAEFAEGSRQFYFAPRAIGRSAGRAGSLGTGAARCAQGSMYINKRQ